MSDDYYENLHDKQEEWRENNDNTEEEEKPEEWVNPNG